MHSVFNWISVHCRTPCTHTDIFTYAYTLSNACSHMGKFLRSGRNLENLEDAHVNWDKDNYLSYELYYIYLKKF